MQQLRSFALPVPPPAGVQDYGELQQNLFKAITPRVIAFSVLSVAPVFGFLRPPSSPTSQTNSPFSISVFFFFNTLALLSCVAGLLVSASHFLSASKSSRFASVGAQRKRLAEDLSKTAAGVACLMLVCVSLAAAYPFAGLTVAGASKTLQYAVVFPSLIGGYVLIEILIYVVKHFFSWWASFMPDHQLWRAIKEDTFFGSFLVKIM